jgi:hypothetical protein
VTTFLTGCRLGKNGLLVGMGRLSLIQPQDRLQGVSTETGKAAYVSARPAH